MCIALELSADVCRGVVTDPMLNTLRRAQRTMKSTRVEEAIELILSIIAELQAGLECRCLGVAIAVPGLTDSQGQTMVISESLGWSDVPLAQRLHERLLCPVTLVNRTRAGAQGEHLCGAGVGVDNLLYVSISSGIGVGIILGGRLFTGAHGTSGELGHTTVLPDGPQCGCGNRGCLETVASIPVIIRNIQGRLQKGEPSLLRESAVATADLQYQQILAAARDGDALVLDEMRQGCRYVGVAIANLIDVLNPERVIIGGQLAEAGEIALSTIRETVQRRSFVPCFSGVQIVRNALGPDSACIGACSVVLEQYIAQVEPAWHARPLTRAR
jgi:predicted NBD/HSP70 family sugar kinase